MYVNYVSRVNNKSLLLTLDTTIDQEIVSGRNCSDYKLTIAGLIICCPQRVAAYITELSSRSTGSEELQTGSTNATRSAAECSNGAC